jgi:hypothetical protein
MHRRSQVASDISAMLKCWGAGALSRNAAAYAALQCRCPRIGHHENSRMAGMSRLFCYVINLM